MFAAGGSPRHDNSWTMAICLFSLRPGITWSSIPLTCLAFVPQPFRYQVSWSVGPVNLVRTAAMRTTPVVNSSGFGSGQNIYDCREDISEGNNESEELLIDPS